MSSSPSPPSADDLWLPEDRFPALAELLRRYRSLPLSCEIASLLQSRLRPRARRLKLTRVARLAAGGHEEPILIQDISTTGVRFLLPQESPVDIARVQEMTLLMKSSDLLRPTSITFVRICARPAQHLDVACRFDPHPLDDGVLARLGNFLSLAPPLG